MEKWNRNSYVLKFIVTWSSARCEDKTGPCTGLELRTRKQSLATAGCRIPVVQPVTSHNFHEQNLQATRSQTNVVLKTGFFGWGECVEDHEFVHLKWNMRQSRCLITLEIRLQMIYMQPSINSHTQVFGVERWAWKSISLVASVFFFLIGG